MLCLSSHMEDLFKSHFISVQPLQIPFSSENETNVTGIQSFKTDFFFFLGKSYRKTVQHAQRILNIFSKRFLDKTNSGKVSSSNSQNVIYIHLILLWHWRILTYKPCGLLYQALFSNWMLIKAPFSGATQTKHGLIIINSILAD